MFERLKCRFEHKLEYAYVDFEDKKKVESLKLEIKNTLPANSSLYLIAMKATKSNHDPTYKPFYDARVIINKWSDYTPDRKDAVCMRQHCAYIFYAYKDQIKELQNDLKELRSHVKCMQKLYDQSLINNELYTISAHKKYEKIKRGEWQNQFNSEKGALSIPDMTTGALSKPAHDDGELSIVQVEQRTFHKK